MLKYFSYLSKNYKKGFGKEYKKEYSSFKIKNSSFKNNFLKIKKSKAQISVEYLIIIGVSLAVLLPGTYFFYGYSKNSNEGAIRSQINQIGNSILTNVESIYGLGDGSMVNSDVRYPKNIRDIYILSDNELVIKYELSSGINEAVFFSDVPMSGNFTYPGRISCTSPCDNSSITSNTITAQGTRKLRFESKTDHVLISLAK